MAALLGKPVYLGPDGSTPVVKMSAKLSLFQAPSASINASRFLCLLSRRDRKNCGVVLLATDRQTDRQRQRV